MEGARKKKGRREEGREREGVGSCRGRGRGGKEEQPYIPGPGTTQASPLGRAPSLTLRPSRRPGQRPWPPERCHFTCCCTIRVPVNTNILVKCVKGDLLCDPGRVT